MALIYNINSLSSSLLGVTFCSSSYKSFRANFDRESTNVDIYFSHSTHGELAHFYPTASQTRRGDSGILMDRKYCSQ